MSVRIRLARGGTKKRPVYRIVAINSHSARDGRFLEKLGLYNPLLPSDSPERVVLREERSATGSATAPSRATGSQGSSTAPGSPPTPCAIAAPARRPGSSRPRRAAAAEGAGA